MTTPTPLALPAAPDSADATGEVPTRHRPRRPEYPPRPAASRRVATMSVGLVVWWQVVVLTGLQFTGGADWVQVSAAVCCALLLVASMVRWGGRWLVDWLGVSVRHRVRTRRAAAAPVPPLVAVGANLETRSYADRAGNLIGLARDGDCWTSLLRVEPTVTTDPDKARRYLADMLPLLVASHDDSEIRLAAVHLVTWAAPLTVNSGGTAGASDKGTAPSAVQRQHWVAVRFAPSLAPAAVAARGGGEIGAMRALSAATLRLAARLTEAGYPVSVCDDADLPVQLATALGVATGGTGDTTPVESWHAWSVGALHQATYRLRRQPRTTATMALAAGRVAAAPALFTSTSILLDRTVTGEVTSQVLFRIGAPAGPAKADQLAALQQAAAGLGADVVRLDGVHGPTVAATLPLGRRARW